MIFRSRHCIGGSCCRRPIRVSTQQTEPERLRRCRRRRRRHRGQQPRGSRDTGAGPFLFFSEERGEKIFEGRHSFLGCSVDRRRFRRHRKKFVCFVFFVFLFRTCRRLARRCSAARTVRPSTTRSGIPTTSRPTTASTTDTCSTSLTTLPGGSTCPDQTR